MTFSKPLQADNPILFDFSDLIFPGNPLNRV